MEVKIKTPDKFTYADYEKWDDDTRWEIIDGEAYMMASPGVSHQRIIGRMFRKIADFLEGKPCEVFISPFDVRLNHDKADNIIVQPDLLVICDREKIANGKNCEGAPDMVVEVLSESSRSMDFVKKFNNYLIYGVKEYWIIDPNEKILHAHTLHQGQGQYFTHVFGEEDTAPVRILDGLEIVLSDIFRN